jgi:hypothetical protein
MALIALKNPVKTQSGFLSWQDFRGSAANAAEVHIQNKERGTAEDARNPPLSATAPNLY